MHGTSTTATNETSEGTDDVEGLAIDADAPPKAPATEPARSVSAPGGLALLVLLAALVALRRAN